MSTIYLEIRIYDKNTTKCLCVSSFNKGILGVEPVDGDTMEIITMSDIAGHYSKIPYNPKKEYMTVRPVEK